MLFHNRGIYARGTVKKNRCMVPSQILLTNADFKKSADGYVQMAVCEFAKMQAFGWNDNNPVHILSKVDVSTSWCSQISNPTRVQFLCTMMGCKEWTVMIN
jgi:hypothetical protein